jgi:lipid-A-disaccharide synthase
MNLDAILDASERLGDEYEFLLPVAPTLDRRFIQALLRSRAGAPVRARRAVEGGGGTTSGSAEIHLVPDALPALAHSRAAIVASGTATVEAAMMETPFVMVYRVTPLTYLLGRWTVKVPHFAMVNLIAGEEVVPELVQRDFTAERVAGEIEKIVPGGAPREKMIAGFRKVKTLLGASAGPRAPDRAAGAICDFLRSRDAGDRSPARYAPTG